MEKSSNSIRIVDVEAASRRFQSIHALDITYFDPAAPIAVLEGNLPHFRQDGATYFITFRTADSLPQAKLRAWQTERDQWLRLHPEPHSPTEKCEYWVLFPERIQHWLDAGFGACHLARPDVRQIVVDALHHFDGSRYRLHAWVAMPNHVHVAVTPFANQDLSEILHSWKSFTSKAINKLLAQTGVFWQKESFDHIVRSPDSMERILAYIFANPKQLEPGTFTLSTEVEKRRDAASTQATTEGH